MDAIPRAAGERVGRYELVARLGSGAAGDVWEALLHGMQGFRKPVALKLLSAGPDRDADRQAVLHEARLGAMLQHPNLVSTYELGHHAGGGWFLVMELVRGPTLSALVKQLGALPLRAVLEAGTQACAALAHLHRAGLVHRDVKPQNLLVDPAGLVKLGDLGVARAVG